MREQGVRPRHGVTVAIVPDGSGLKAVVMLSSREDGVNKLKHIAMGIKSPLTALQNAERISREHGFDGFYDLTFDASDLGNCRFGTREEWSAVLSEIQRQEAALSEKTGFRWGVIDRGVTANIAQWRGPRGQMKQLHDLWEDISLRRRPL
jgi:hypothetical protein